MVDLETNCEILGKLINIPPVGSEALLTLILHFVCHIIQFPSLGVFWIAVDQIFA